MLPLIFAQIVTIYIWGCETFIIIGLYRETISKQPQLHFDEYTNILIRNLFNYAIVVDPVGVFLYTWQLLPTLMIECKEGLLAKCYRYYYKLSIWIMPLTFVGLYLSFSFLVANKKMLDSSPQGNNNTEEAEKLSQVINALFKSQGYFTTTTNIISCIILFMTIRHAYQLT